MPGYWFPLVSFLSEFKSQETIVRTVAEKAFAEHGGDPASIDF